MKYLRQLVLSALLLISAASIADPLPNTNIIVNGFSWHSTPDHNPINLGGGIERRIATSLSDNVWISAGFYKNSNWKRSYYAMARHEYHFSGNWTFGISGGLVTNYERPITPVIIPDACYKVICFLALPKFTPSGSWIVGTYLRIPLN